MTAALRAARASDWPSIATLLENAQLPLDGAEDHLETFVVAVNADDRVVGAGGLELYGDAALLRSLVVESPGSGLGTAIVTRLLADAEARGVRDVVLLTTTAPGFFPRFGFEPITRDEVPSSVRSSVEFRGACPASAQAMRRSSVVKM
ncbi:MAG TPA: arsenic resistance N-acetyltransferase ArsN2 [Luteitalea sp.]|nr:arsenic resistance N-acetyltransferase ArsN2 [Luteitalea sp.]